MTEQNSINKQSEDFKISKATGDPFINFDLTGTQDYAIGIDDSDGDKLKITDSTDPSSGNEIIEADPAAGNAITFNKSYTFPVADGTVNQVLTTNGAGAVSWQSAPEGISWTEVTATTVSMSPDDGYILNNAALVTATLPVTIALGQRVRVAGKGAGGWTIAQNAGQTIHFGNQDTTTGGAGSLSSTNQYDSIELLCITANSGFLVLSSVGNITIV